MKKVYLVIETTDYFSNILGIFEDENDARKLCNSSYTHIEAYPYNLYAKDEYFNRVEYQVFTDMDNEYFDSKENAEKFIKKHKYTIFGIRNVKQSGSQRPRVEYYVGNNKTDKEEMKNILLSIGADYISNEL